MPNMLINSASRQLAALHRYFSATGSKRAFHYNAKDLNKHLIKIIKIKTSISLYISNTCNTHDAK